MFTVRQIASTTACKKHGKKHGVPCWWIHPDNGKGLLAGICNARARAAGAVGTISDGAIRRYNKKQETSA